MQIGTLSKRTGVSVRMLRFYEQQGLIAPGRTAAGYRRFGPREEKTVGLIQQLGSAGLPLRLIRQFLPCALDEHGSFLPCDELVELVEEQLSKLDQQLEELSQGRAHLANLQRRLRKADDKHPPM